MKNVQPKLCLKVIEINNADGDPDILIADDDANVPAVMLGTEAVYGQVADRLTGDIIVKSVNLFPELLGALEALFDLMDDGEGLSAADPEESAIANAKHIIAKAKGG